VEGTGVGLPFFLFFFEVVVGMLAAGGSGVGMNVKEAWVLVVLVAGVGS
jgi:hypothetical protein